MVEKKLSEKKLLSLLKESDSVEDKAGFLRALRGYVEDCVSPEMIEMVDEDKSKKFLSEKLNLLLSKNDFKPGMFVKWKKGLKNRRKPKESEVAIVIERLSTPVFDPNNDSSSPYFREPLDLILGLMDPDDDELIIYHFDSRRFEIV